MLKWVLVLIVIVASGLWGYDIGTFYQRDTSGLTVVDSVCDRSHVLDSGEWEEACGVAQDSINAEYICNKELSICNSELKSTL